jgi:uncharacterized protein YhaN
MRASRLSIHGFGRLAGRDFELGDGLTVVHGPNEAGKSTFHAALVAALFGLLGGGRRTKEGTALLERHRPWTGARYGAAVELAGGDRSLRLQWDFERGHHTVLDAVTGVDLTAEHGGGTDAARLVRALHGVDRATYLRVGCVRQAELAAVEDPAGVRHAVEAALSDAAGDASAESAADAVRAARATAVGLNNSRGKPLPMARTELTAAVAAVAAAEADRHGTEELARQRDEARDRAAELAGRVHELESIRDHLRADALRRRVAGAERLAVAVADAERTVAACSARASFEPEPALPAWRDRLGDLRAARRPGGEDAAALAALEAREGEAAVRIAELEPARGSADREAQVERAVTTAAGPSARAAGATLAAGVVLAGGGAATGFSAAIVAGLLAAVAGIVLAVGARRRSSALQRALPGSGTAGERLAAFRHAVACDRELTAIERELAAIRLDAARVRERLAGERRVDEELAGLEERVAAALRERGFDVEDMDGALVAYDVAAAERGAYDRGAAERDRAGAELARLLDGDSIEEARTRLGRLERELNGHGPAARGRDADEVEAELAAAAAERDAAVARAERAEGEAATRLELAADVAAAREREAAAREEVARLERVDAVLELAERELRAAAAATYRDVAPRLNAALGAGIERLTGGRYRRALVDETLAVRLEAPETGSMVGLDAVSAGTAKQVFLVERLELVRLLCPDVTLPVLLDDPFAHFDAERIAATLVYLAELAAERQIVVFTTQAEVAALAPASATVIELERPGE